MILVLEFEFFHNLFPNLIRSQSWRIIWISVGVHLMLGLVYTSIASLFAIKVSKHLIFLSNLTPLRVNLRPLLHPWFRRLWWWEILNQDLTPGKTTLWCWKRMNWNYCSLLGMPHQTAWIESQQNYMVGKWIFTKEVTMRWQNVGDYI